MKLALTFAAAAAVLATVSEAKTQSIPLKKREFSFEERVYALNKFDGSKYARLGASAPSSIKVNDYMNAQYFAEAKVGTPAQSMMFIYDTGSSNLWVPNKKPFLSSHKIYDHSKSSTYKANGTEFKIQYGSGPVSGFYSRDNVQIGDYTLNNYLFAEVNNTAGLGFGYRIGKFDGILGLGWDTISVDHVPTPVDALVASGQLAENSFSFYLGNNADGELLLGGTNKAHYTGDLVTIPLSSETYWEIELDDIKYDGASVSSTKKAIIDSGTSTLAGPTAEVQALAKKFGATSILGKEFVVSCTADVKPVTFTLGGKDFTLSFQDIILQKSGSQCVLGLLAIDVPAPNGPLWILGDVFMRKYYVNFNVDEKAVKIAQSA